MKDTPPGSSAGIHCHQDGCVEALVLGRTTAVQPTHEDDYQKLMPACHTAAALLGWRVYQNMFWCPTHVGVKKLVCARCISPCAECACMCVPGLEAIEWVVE